MSHDNFRETKDLDVAISPGHLARTVREALLANHGDSFITFTDPMVFVTADGQTQVDIVSVDNLEYPLAGMPLISGVLPQQLQIATAAELAVLKAYSCGSRYSLDKNVKDARDVASMLQWLAAHGQALNADQRRRVRFQGRWLRKYATDVNWDAALP
ncbi:hypothetical protein P170DRAFT_463198 [Aspergillus steynii IBT 23096]|uniref:Uncharacterized protein n=1 Tax=Aspergillus steynii IBT 23096 TaxID=1392250 RepID=A0A2I2GKX5_9EURO|nr:uncharacterized protein P170DRAFT_463198 [Aspergillus steynii IBT 23096]PLB53543.1 hypothetical protein P170DRAFT_463198 [Aspergillus steynii IBT 23096]